MRENVRNFCIIAHIDHGKSTLADRLIQHCGGVDAREFRDQILDSMDIERERGITIKSNTITLDYKAKDGETYQLNLIDTPGHVDFSHEVRRSLMSCEGALLLVDASQGVEAQTVANLYLALEYDLELLPVINKIDLPSADVERVQEEIEADLGLDPAEAVLCSAKQGTGIDDVLEAIVNQLPPPAGDRRRAAAGAASSTPSTTPTAASCCSAGSCEGTLRPGQTDPPDAHRQGATRSRRSACCSCARVKTDELGRRRGGLRHRRHQDGARHRHRRHASPTPTRPAAEPLPGYKEAKPVVFSSIYPMSHRRVPELTKALDKLALNDAALTYEKDSSAALGYGFRCGFLGLLHLEVVQERLRARVRPVAAALRAVGALPRRRWQNGEVRRGRQPELLSRPRRRSQAAEEPFIKASVMMPERYIGPVMELCRERRGVNDHFNYLAVGRVELTSELPLAEVLFDFYDRLKTVTQGYGSFDYEMLDYRATDLVKVDILVNGEPVDALSQLVHRDKARRAGAALLRAAGRDDPAPPVQDRHPGRHRRHDHRPHHHQRLAQGRHRQVLRRRHHPQAQAAREAEGGQEAHEDGGHGRDPPVGLRRGAEDRQGADPSVGPGSIPFAIPFPFLKTDSAAHRSPSDAPIAAARLRCRVGTDRSATASSVGEGLVRAQVLLAQDRSLTASTSTFPSAPRYAPTALAVDPIAGVRRREGYVGALLQERHCAEWARPALDSLYLAAAHPPASTSGDRGTVVEMSDLPPGGFRRSPAHRVRPCDVTAAILSVSLPSECASRRRRAEPRRQRALVSGRRHDATPGPAGREAGPR